MKYCSKELLKGKIMTLNDYINSIRGKRICVIGIGVSNEPWIRLLAFEGCDVTARDKRSFEQLGMKALELVSMGVKLKLGEDYLEDLNYDVIFRTPGLMPFDEHLEKARENGAVITSEMELFLSLCPCRVFAVTGSDGKTTTTTIISELLKASGYKVHLGGNIGNPLLCNVPFMKKEDVVVLELSSFQLHSMTCRPDVAVITNISPNHLDKHKDFEDYVSAKESIFLRQDESCRLVLSAEDEYSARFAGKAASEKSYFSIEGETENGAFLKDGTLFRTSAGNARAVMQSEDILLLGEHNIKNYLAAFAATEGWVSDEVCAEVAKSFKGVEHRLESVRVRRGVRYINDSIGSSPTRTIAGLKALKTKPIIIVGGYDKLIPFDSLGDELCKRAKAVIFTGATADKIEQAVVRSEYFEGAGLIMKKVPEFDGAVYAAVEMAGEGDIVLLSPACASFDCFQNFAERGNHFKKLIMELAE